MHTREGGRRVQEIAVRTVRFLRRRKRLGIALVMVAPLLLGMGPELFVLNLLGLGIGFLFIRSQVRRRKQGREHRLWLERRAERDEWEHQRRLKRREREAAENPG